MLPTVLGILDYNIVSSITTVGAPPVRFSVDGFKKAFISAFVDIMIPVWVNSPKFIEEKPSMMTASQFGFLDSKFSNFVKGLRTSDPLMRRHLFLKLTEYNKPEYAGTVLDAEKFKNETNIPLCILFDQLDGTMAKNYFNQMDKNFKPKIIDACH